MNTKKELKVHPLLKVEGKAPAFSSVHEICGYLQAIDRRCKENDPTLGGMRLGDLIDLSSLPVWGTCEGDLEGVYSWEEFQPGMFYLLRLSEDRSDWYVAGPYIKLIT